MEEALIYSINVSSKKGVPKKPVEEIKLIENFGMEGDAHSKAESIRQVSFLALESIEKQKQCPKVQEAGVDLSPGAFAENITTKNIDLKTLRISDRMTIRDDIILEVSKIGKECHQHCSIYLRTGDCIMPRECIFVRVIKGGVIKKGDAIKVTNV